MVSWTSRPCTTTCWEIATIQRLPATAGALRTTGLRFPRARRPIYLSADGGLTTDQGGVEGGPAHVSLRSGKPVPITGRARCDQAAAARPAVDQFSWRRSQVRHGAADRTAGSHRLRYASKLFVSSDAPDTDFTAKLVDIYPDGREIAILNGIQRVKFRKGFENPDPLPTGTVGELTLDCWSISIIVQHRSPHRRPDLEQQLATLRSQSQHGRRLADLHRTEQGRRLASRHGELAHGQQHHLHGRRAASVTHLAGGTSESVRSDQRKMRRPSLSPVFSQPGEATPENRTFYAREGLFSVCPALSQKLLKFAVHGRHGWH